MRSEQKQKWSQGEKQQYCLFSANRLRSWSHSTSGARLVYEGDEWRRSKEENVIESTCCCVDCSTAVTDGVVSGDGYRRCFGKPDISNKHFSLKNNEEKVKAGENGKVSIYHSWKFNSSESFSFTVFVSQPWLEGRVHVHKIRQPSWISCCFTACWSKRIHQQQQWNSLPGESDVIVGNRASRCFRVWESNSAWLLLIHLKATRSFDLCAASFYFVGGRNGRKYQTQREMAVCGMGIDLVK